MADVAAAVSPMNKFGVVQSIIDRWRRMDIEAVLECVSENIEYHYLIGVKPLRGKGEMREFLQRFGADQSDIKWKVLNFAERDNTLLVEGLDDYIDGKGRRIQTPYMGIFEFEDGLVRRWRDYLDPALIRKDKIGEPQDEWVNALIARGEN